MSELSSPVADPKLARYRPPGLPGLELAGVLPQRGGGNGGAVAVRLRAVALRFAAAAFGGVAGGYVLKRGRPSFSRRLALSASR